MIQSFDGQIHYLFQNNIKFAKMHACEVAFYGAGAFYALFMDRAVLFTFFTILALYMILPCCIPNAKQVSTHRRVLQAGWSDPSEPNVLVKVPIRTEKVEKII